MGDMSKWDSSSLIAAALAPPVPLPPSTPVTGFKEVGQQRASSHTSRSLISSDKLRQPRQTSSGLVKRRKRASSVSSRTGRHEETPSVSKQSQKKGKSVSFSETSARDVSLSSDHDRTLKTTNRNTYHRDSRLCDSEDSEDEDLPAITKQRGKTEKRVKRHPEISKQELADLGINPDLPQRKPRTADHDEENNLEISDDDADDEEASITHSRTDRRSAPGPAVKRPLLIIRSNPFTPSPPESPERETEKEPDTDDDIDPNDDDDEYTESPQAKKKRKNNVPTPTKPSSAKSTSTKRRTRHTRTSATGPSTPTGTAPPSARSLSAKNRTYHFPVAGALSAASEADKLIFRMRGQGKSWKEINAEWAKLTGKVPGDSSLSVRFLKLRDKFRRLGDQDLARLLHHKTAVERNFEANEKWDRIAALIAADGGGTYTGQALKIKFRNLVEVGGLARGDRGVVENAGGGEDESGDGDMGVESMDEWDRELMDGVMQQGDGVMGQENALLENRLPDMNLEDVGVMPIDGEYRDAAAADDGDDDDDVVDGFMDSELVGDD